MFQAWTRDDPAGARKEATPQAVKALFARTWHAADGWSFDHCEAAAGSFFCTWVRPGGQLILAGNDNTALRVTGLPLALTALTAARYAACSALAGLRMFRCIV